MDWRLPPLLGAALLLGGLALGGCASVEDRALGLGPGDPSQFRRVAVLPFSDARGRGAQVAARLARLLPAQGFDPVDQAQLDHVVAGLDLEPGEELSLSTLNDIREQTLAQAVVMGSIDSRWKEAALVVAETQTGDVVYKAFAKPAHGSFSDAEDVARRCAQAMSRWPAHPPKGQTFGSLPDPD